MAKRVTHAPAFTGSLCGRPGPQDTSPTCKRCQARIARAVAKLRKPKRPRFTFKEAKTLIVARARVIHGHLLMSGAESTPRLRRHLASNEIRQEHRRGTKLRPKSLWIEIPGMVTVK